MERVAVLNQIPGRPSLAYRPCGTIPNPVEYECCLAESSITLKPGQRMPWFWFRTSSQAREAYIFLYSSASLCYSSD